MERFKKGMILVALLALVFTMTACQTPEEEPVEKEEAKESVELLISAAASLRGAMTEIQTLYLEEAPDVILTFNFGSSGALAQQIQQGAQADVFMSASSNDMKTLEDASLMDDSTVADIVGNEVVLVVPEDSTSTITEFQQVTSDEITKLALGEAASVPAGRYAHEVFTFLNIDDQITEKVVNAKDVKEVLTWVETGNVDAGVVYSTDAKDSTAVRVIAFAPAGSHGAIVYPAGVVKASENTDAAKDFVEFLASSKAKDIFEEYGFIDLK